MAISLSELSGSLSLLTLTSFRKHSSILHLKNRIISHSYIDYFRGNWLENMSKSEDLIWRIQDGRQTLPLKKRLICNLKDVYFRNSLLQNIRHIIWFLNDGFNTAVFNFKIENGVILRLTIDFKLVNRVFLRSLIKWCLKC